MLKSSSEDRYPLGKEGSEGRNRAPQRHSPCKVDNERQQRQWTLLVMMVRPKPGSWAGHPMDQTKEPGLGAKDAGKLLVDHACKQPRVR